VVIVIAVLTGRLCDQVVWITAFREARLETGHEMTGFAS